MREKLLTFCAGEAVLEHLDELKDLYLAEQRLIKNRSERRGREEAGYMW